MQQRLRSAAMSIRRPVLLLLAALAMAGLITVGNADTAAAECKPTLVPMVAGDGISGLIDDQTSAGNPETLYGQYGWAGLQWTTCDLETGRFGVPKEESINVTFDTWGGNLGLQLAVLEAAAMSQLHQWAAKPGELLGPVDGMQAEVTGAIKESVWDPFAQAIIILSAIGVLVLALRREVRRAARTVVAVMIAAFAITWLTVPITQESVTDTVDPDTGQPITETVTLSGSAYTARLFDGVAAEIVGEVDKSINSAVANADDAVIVDDEARGAALHDSLLFKIWMRGALGSDETAHKDWGEKLYKASAVSWDEKQTAEQNEEPIDPEDKKNEYNELANEIKDADPAAYDSIRGVKQDRDGFGLLAAVVMTAIALIRIPAEMLMVAGMLIMRVLVMFGPIFALAAILEATRPFAKAAVKIGLAAVVNVTIYGVIAAIHTAATAAIVTYADSLTIATVLIVALTIVVWIVSKPFRSVTRLATGDQAAEEMTNAGSAGSNALSKLGGLALGYGAGASRQGNVDELLNRKQKDDEEGEPERPREDPIPPPAEDTQPSEPIRPDPIPVVIIPDTAGAIGTGAPTPAGALGPGAHPNYPTLGPGYAEETRALEGNPATNGHRGPDDTNDGPGTTRGTVWRPTTGDQAEPGEVEPITTWHGTATTADDEKGVQWREVPVPGEPNIFRAELIDDDVIEGSVVEGESIAVEDHINHRTHIDDTIEDDRDTAIDGGPVTTDDLRHRRGVVDGGIATVDDQINHRTHVVIDGEVVDRTPIERDPEPGPDGKLTYDLFRPSEAELKLLEERRREATMAGPR